MKLSDRKSVNILIVEDEDASRNGLVEYFNLKGYKVFSADRLKSAFEILNSSAELENNKDKIDIIITDLKLPDGTGLELLKSIKEGLNQNAEVIIATGFSSVKTAVEAIKLGAYDYITKPVNLEELDLLISRIISNKNLIDELNILKNRLDEKYNFGNLITSSRKMIETVDTAISVSGTNSTVLIEGESGTGKELLANIIVNNSKRKNKSFVKVNCAALSETVLENELFGHEKGAYTGADSLYKGRFEIADGGTIFLDEIGEISLKTQTKILRVLQEKEFERVGGSKTIKIDIRIIAASQDITKKVSNGEFRKDLYYRLNVINLNLIPLRERKEDIPLLVKRFLSDFAEENGKKITGLNKEVFDILLNYDYPGNVRELKNIIEYMTAVSKGSVIDESSIPGYLKKINQKKETYSDSGGKDFIKIPFGISLEDAENIIIKKTLEINGFNKAKTANDLKIGLKTVYRKLEKN
ncbi:MAG: sigma-54 dependent transcriptional regulator [Deltaproteobacteria bacterium]|jgi:Response regulator containing CheY-like receiver, AAA-type ATPase, and DNA-binding domains|nr:sigma-54 dependent transcriptional regulator [Deltaproteobacteria bacterium]MCL6119911.1 sigma-54 dependent transcriptional regulator [Deltaproteobacteria bacterium]MDA8298399.1 sigma-54 dependent transcriptional regulator [Deltaproteobacteria bacterium]